MTIEAEAASLPEDDAPRSSARRLGLRVHRFFRLLADRMASSLSRRIIVLNLAGLVALMLGYLYLNQFRAGLIEARVQSLVIQGEIIASAIATQATVEMNTLRVDPDKLLQQQAGEAIPPKEDDGPALSFSINPERVAPLMRRLTSPTKTRARVFDTSGSLVVDSRTFYSAGEILNPGKSGSSKEDRTIFERTFSLIKGTFGRAEIQLGEDFSSPDARSFPEVVRALKGVAASAVRVNQAGQTIVAVAMPIQRFQIVRGALFLSTEGGDIDAVIATERWAIVQIFLVAAAVMLVLSFLLAGTIAGPMSRLAEAAERVRHGGVEARVEIPDFTARADEIGHLSGALRDMTKALYNRIEAIESFAADVAHELKNPLTSLRSATETLPLARNEDSRKRLMAVIQHDVQRLNRLISDISDASRLDAELARAVPEPIDVARLAEAVIAVQNEQGRKQRSPIRLEVAPTAEGDKAFRVLGHDARLGRVLVNLIENARSFSPDLAPVRVAIARRGRFVEIRVEDSGPGIPDHAFERIFERFYTDRPQQGFGENSGLGLSISRQIVDAHGGRIHAENIAGKPDGDGSATIAGARFTVLLPAMAG